jgi:hypothetical protein
MPHFVSCKTSPCLRIHNRISVRSWEPHSISRQTRLMRVGHAAWQQSNLERLDFPAGCVYGSQPDLTRERWTRLIGQRCLLAFRAPSLPLQFSHELRKNAAFHAKRPGLQGQYRNHGCFRPTMRALPHVRSTVPQSLFLRCRGEWFW